MNIGLLGGSFNPAHEGHVYISNMAIKKLGLEQMWWLITPQNPLKKQNQKESIKNRLKSATNINKNYKVKPITLEKKIGTIYSYDTLTKLKTRMPRANFFWIMGSDNLYNLHRWYNWKKLFYLCPVVVFNRPGYFYKSLSSKAAKYYWRYKININRFDKFSKTRLPMWIFVNNSYNRNSSTELRKVSKDYKYCK